MKQLYAALLVLVSFGFFQCQRQLGFTGAPDPGAPLVVNADPVKASLQGNVTDENGLPSAGVLVTVGSRTVTTNALGYFRLNDASLDKNSSLVVAEKTGYFRSYRVFPATSGTNQVSIKMIKKEIAGTVSGSAGGTVTLANGSKISLPAGGIVDAAFNTAYSGEVRVYASYIDPTATDIAQRVPGSFVADDKTGGRVILTSYGMMVVEMETAGGAKLQIKKGSAATLTMPIPVSIQGSATPTIPLWYVNETTGIWQEEGLATKQGNQYVGEVKHFSYWNCDIPGKTVPISLTLKTAAGLPIVHAHVQFGAEGVYGATAHGYTDSLGEIRGFVPAGRTLNLRIFDACNGLVYTQVIQPVNLPTELGTITVASTTASIVTFEGKITDCNNAPVKNGYAVITFRDGLRYAKTNANGDFSVSFVSCSAAAGTAQVLAVDDASQQQGAVVTVNVTAPATNAGTLKACGTSAAQFFNFTLDGVDYKVDQTSSDSLFAYVDTLNTVTIYGAQANKLIRVETRNVTGAATYPLTGLEVQNYYRTVLKTPFNIVFTTNAASSGQFFEGTLAGQFTDNTSPTVHSLNGSFKVRRR